MLMIDGVVVRSRPITIAHLYCGCTKFHAGHEIQVDDFAICAEPDTCPGTLERPASYGALRALSAVESMVRTYVVG